MKDNLIKITVKNCKDIVPAEDYEQVKTALQEFVSVVFPFKISSYYDPNEGYAVYWEMNYENDDEPIADQMTLEEYLNTQYVLCTSFHQWAKETQRGSKDKIFLDELSKETPQCHLKDRFGNSIIKGMPVIFFNENYKGNFIHFDTGTIVGYSNEYVKIEPTNHDDYVYSFGPNRRMPRLVLRKPNRIMIGISGLPKMPEPPKKEGEDEKKEVVEPENTNINE